jgi:hypothetical protein
MRPLKTTFYDTASGVQFTMSWDSEEEFMAAREFLYNLTGGLLDTSNEIDFCILDTMEQREAMYDYRQELRRAKRR